MASQVVDTCHGRHWDLQPLPCPDCRQLPVHTVTTAVSDYPDAAAYDMEAAGFIATALKFAPLAKLQVLKIISDNRAHPSQAISARMVTDLLLQQATLIRQLINRMRYDHDPLSTP
jgi:hypothetical protein